MKKLFTALMLAAMVLSTGCGNQVEDAKKSAEQKVEQAKDAAVDAQKKVEQEAAKNVDAVKEEAKKVEEKTEQTIKETAQMAQDAKQDIEAKINGMENASVRERMQEFAFEGVAPGMKFDEVKNILGEPVSEQSESEFIFGNGLIIEIDKENNVVKSIEVYQAGVPDAKGVEVGMIEYVLNDKRGPADSVETNEQREVEYKYHAGGAKFESTYVVRDGVITGIKNKINN